MQKQESDMLALATALQELATAYPTDDEAAPVTLVELRDPATGQHRRIDLQPGHVAWLLGLVMDETATTHNAHPGGTGECAHCAGTGHSRKDS